MLGRTALLRASSVVLARAPRLAATSNVCRTMTTESHDDFKPKRKVIEEGMDAVVKLIDQQVKENDIMLYMKGTPQQPQCGFSLQAVRILNALGVDFASVNVLEYPAVREGIKIYSDWPTLPQLYVAGEFVGGCDIMSTMYQEGQLEKLFKDKKLLK